MTRERVSGWHLLLSCEHAAALTPAAYASLFDSPEAAAALGSHRGSDLGADLLSKAIRRRTGAELVSHATTRLLVDVNRSLGHPRLFSEFSRVLSPEAREEVVEQYYQPHRQRVRQAAERLQTGGFGVVHIGVHSFTPQWNGVERSAEIGLLYDPSRGQEAHFCRMWAQVLRRDGPGWRVRRNYPYLGKSDGLTTALRKAFSAETYLGVELEVNQRLLEDPKCIEAVADGLQLESVNAMLAGLAR